MGHDSSHGLLPMPGAARGRTGGFTLLELLIVVAIIAILAAIAMPIYQSYILRSRRAQGRAALMTLLQQEEAYMMQNGSYLTFTAGDATNGVFKAWSNDSSSSADAAWLIGAKLCPNTTASTGSTKPTDCIEAYATPNTPTFPDPAISELDALSTGQQTCTATSTSLCWDSP